MPKDGPTDAAAGGRLNEYGNCSRLTSSVSVQPAPLAKALGDVRVGGDWLSVWLSGPPDYLPAEPDCELLAGA